MKAKCALCKKAFDCGANLWPSARCWCESKATITIKDQSKSCLCESCFDNALAADRRLCFRLYVSYVGSNFSGFQQQANARTVGGELALALKSLFKNDFTMQVAGRTDAGVHARGQIVSLECESQLSARQLTLALAAKLPKDMSVWRIEEMPLGFNARTQSIGKRYVYRIHQGLTADPFTSAYSLHQKTPLDVVAMDRAAQSFVGEHDFESFRSSFCVSAHARRYLWHVRVNKSEPLIEIDVRGNAFCMHMVRIMVGTLIEVGRKKRDANDIARALAGQDRKLAGPTAKAYGLTLEQVYYQDDLSTAGIPTDARFPRYPSR